MLSRVAERMYWAGRYLERVEAMARLVRTHTALLLDLPENSGSNWTQLLRIINAEADFSERYTNVSERNVVTYLLADRTHSGSVLSSLAQLRENIRTSRDIVPREGWECVNEFYLMVHGRIDRAGNQPKLRQDILVDCVQRCQRLSGLLAGTMSHGDGYNFMLIGGYLERADMTSRVVDVAAATLATGNSKVVSHENTLWMSVLKSLSAYQMYRQYVRRRVTAPDVVKFLLSDSQFPRAVAWSLQQLRQGLQTLPSNGEALSIAEDLLTQSARSEPQAFSSEDLHIFIDQLQLRLGDLHSAIDATWFLKPSR